MNGNPTDPLTLSKLTSAQAHALHAEAGDGNNVDDTVRRALELASVVWVSEKHGAELNISIPAHPQEDEHNVEL